MAAKREKDEVKGPNKADSDTPRGNKRALLAAAVVAVFIILLIAFVYQYAAPAPQSQSSASLGTFLGSFSTAPRAGLAVMYSNGTTFAVGITCATAVIEQLTGNRQTHRNVTTLDFFVINQSATGQAGCLAQNGLGAKTTNSYNATSSACLAQANSEPTIFISHNSTNATHITASALRIQGTVAYLEQCGIASAISAVK